MTGVVHHPSVLTKEKKIVSPRILHPAMDGMILMLKTHAKTRIIVTTVEAVEEEAVVAAAAVVQEVDGEEGVVEAEEIDSIEEIDSMEEIDSKVAVVVGVVEVVEAEEIWKIVKKQQSSRRI